MDWKKRLQKLRRPSKLRRTAALPLPGEPSVDSVGVPSSKTVPDSSSVAQTSPQLDIPSSVRAGSALDLRRGALPPSQIFWNVAYDSLENDADTAVLARTYIELLNEILGSEKAPSPSSVPEPTNPKDRETCMRDLTEKGFDKILKGPAIAKPAGSIIQHIFVVRNMMGEVLALRSLTALPWPGVCVGMLILLSLGDTNKSNLRGIVHIGSRMQWYCRLPATLAEETNVVGLYKAILLYQMKIAHHFYTKSRFPQTFQAPSVLGLEDWDANLKQVIDAEKTVLKHLEQYGVGHSPETSLSLEWFSRIEDHTEAMQRDLRQDLQDFIDQQKRATNNTDTTAMLRDLFVFDPQYEMSRLEGGEDELISAVYNWFLDSEEYAAWTNWSQTWNSPTPRRFLWVNGLPGTGKTMLFITIIRQLLSQPAMLAPSVSYFFCQRANVMMNNATAVLRSLLWMLLIQQPHLVPHLLLKYKYAGQSLFGDGNAFFALSDAFTDMLKDPELPGVYFIIDALDECGEGRDHLLRLISLSLQLTDKVKWLVSARPGLDVLGQLNSLRHIPAVVELDAKAVDQAIHAYVDQKISALGKRRRWHGDTLTKVSRILHARAGNTFIWVSLVLRELENAEEREARGILESSLSGLSELYGRMAERIEAQVSSRDLCKKVLLAVCLAYRYLTLDELGVLAELPSTIEPREIVESCGSFLTIVNGSVSLIHLSAKEYLLGSQLDWFPRGTAQEHADITKRLLHAMSSALRRDIYSLQDFGVESNNLITPDPNPLASLNYACGFWLDHLLEASRTPGFLESMQVSEFLQRHLLHWLEALSLSGRLSDISSLFVRVLSTYQGRSRVENPSESIFLNDVAMFFRSYASIIERAPLQAYGAALVFSPLRSKMKELYWKERLPEVKVISGLREDWGSLIQTLEGHSGVVWSVAFSPDGTTLASASSDGTIRLWEALTGTQGRVLEHGNGAVNAVVFSPDGSMLASASDNKSIKLWEVSTGLDSLTLEGHTGAVSGLAFSPDSRSLASASYDKTIRLWDLDTGSPTQLLRGHSGAARSVSWCWSGVRQTLVSSSDDKTVRVWDTARGVEKQTLDSYDSAISYIAISPDEQTFASTSTDNKIRLHDLSTGVETQELVAHSSPPYAVAFSPDGKMLASGSSDTTIRLWDLKTGSSRQTLEGHTGTVWAVAFSPDGRTLASASSDETVRLWNVSTITPQSTPASHGGTISIFAVSPDGQTLASAASDNTIRLWDMNTSAQRWLLESHKGTINLVVFSTDSKMLASAAADKTIRLWDLEIGVQQQILNSQGDEVANVIVFSPSNKTLISASSDKIIRVWDIATATVTQALKGHDGLINGIALSPDTKTLASASDDKTVRLWSTSTGKEKWILEGHSGPVTSVTFSPDLTTVASASYDKTVRVWSLETGLPTLALEGHLDWVHAVAYSADSATLASASSDETVRLWDMMTGAEMQTLPGHHAIASLAFSQDGRQHLVTNRGSINVGSSSGGAFNNNRSTNKSPLGSVLFVSDDWVSLNGKKVLWLPPDYRSACTAVCNDRVALRHMSNRVTCLEFVFP